MYQEKGRTLNKKLNKTKNTDTMKAIKLYNIIWNTECCSQSVAAKLPEYKCFTTKDDNLYIIEFERPDPRNPLVIKNMPKLNPKAEMIFLGTEEDVVFQGQKGVKYNMLKWKQDKKGTLTIDFSSIDTKKLNALENAWVIKVFGMED